MSPTHHLFLPAASYRLPFITIRIAVSISIVRLR